MKKLLILWLAPVLLALFPTLTTYHHNLDQLAFNRLTIPLVYSLGFVLVSGAVALAVFKSQRKASLFTSLWIVLFFSFGYLYLKLGETHLVQLLPVSLNTLLIGLFGLILLGVGMALFKKEPAKKLSNFVLIVGLTTVALNLWTILPFELQRQLAETRLQKYLLLNPMLPSSVEEPALKPDVYYFIFDRYARQDVLAEYFHFDNQETLQALAQNNFFIGTQSFANYPNTYLSLASSLNLRYLDFLPQTLGVKNRDRIPAYQQLIQSNELVRFLKLLMPTKRTAELYIGLGYHKHGKTELYRELLDHQGVCSLDRFGFAAGAPPDAGASCLPPHAATLAARRTERTNRSRVMCLPRTFQHLSAPCSTSQHPSAPFSTLQHPPEHPYSVFFNKS